MLTNAIKSGAVIAFGLYAAYYIYKRDFFCRCVTCVSYKISRPDVNDHGYGVIMQKSYSVLSVSDVNALTSGIYAEVDDITVAYYHFEFLRFLPWVKPIVLYTRKDFHKKMVSLPCYELK